jgi:DNA polymerase IV (DinB-like DNA polymerase)
MFDDARANALPQRVIMHADLDYFYAQCEENRNPSIRGKPVVVCVYSGRTEESGVVSTCNYEARRFGVKAGIPIVRAKRLLENVETTFLPMNRPLYEAISNRIMDILRANADCYERVGIDEAYLDISTRTNGDFDKAKRVALNIKEQVVQQEHITCSIGIAPNKLIAKIASDHQKPNGLTIVKPENANEFLRQLPVNKIPGVGKKAEEKLRQLHVTTVEQLSAYPPSILLQTFGKNLGGYLYRAARGEDDEPVKERDQPTQLSRIGTLKKNTRELADILPLLNELTASVAAKLKESNLTCKSVGIIAILDNLNIHSKSKTLDPPTSDGSVIKDLCVELFGQFLRSMPTATVRRAGVKLTNLSKRTGQTDISKFLGETR